MSEIITQTVYFSESGKVNTGRTLTLAYKRAAALGLKTAVIATTTGATAVQAAHLITKCAVIAVTHSTGFRQPYQQSLTDKNRASLDDTGVRILTTTHAFGGVGRAVRKKLHTYQVDEIIAFTLRTFGQGIKVVAEITLMVADAGLFRSDQPILVVAGSDRGADTAAIVQPTHAQTFFDLKFLEIIWMPAPGHPGLA